MKKLKVCLVGIGFIGRQHVEAIRRIPAVEIAAVSDLNEEATRIFCEENAIPGFYTDYREMLDTEKPDIVHVCTPNWLHFEVSCEALKRGINVYCEKPLALDPVQTGELCRLAKEHNVLGAVNYNYRQNAQAREMHARIHKADGSWGKTFFVSGWYYQGYNISDWGGGWKYDIDKGGKTRALADIGSHWIDLAQYVTGQKIRRVMAEFTMVYPYRKKRERGKAPEEGQLIEVKNEDIAQVMMEFDDGSKGNLIASVAAAGHKNDLSISIDGSRYAMRWDQENPDKLLIETNEEGVILKHAGPEVLSEEARPYGTLPSGHPVGWADAFRNGIRAFYNCVRGKEEKEYATFEDGDYVVRILEACYESNLKKQWVEVK